MNFHQLRVFSEVVKARSFSGAAERLHLTQPAVTYQIKNLEEYYELKIFERMEKKAILTEEGRLLFNFAEQILNLSRQAEEALTDLKGLSRGALRIDSVFTFGDYYLSTLLGAFHKKYPKITIQVSTGNTSQVIDNTLLRKNDLAFVAYEPRDERLKALEFTTDLLVGVVSAGHRFARRRSIALRELQDESLILRERGSSPRRILDEIFQKKGISPMIIMESASTSAIKKMVESGAGMAILSRQVIKKEVAAQSLKELPFKDAEIAYRFYLIYHQDKYFSRALQAFMKTALDFSRKPWPE